MADGTPSPQNRIPRTLSNLVEALRRQIRLLKEFSERAFERGEVDYCGEIANKLRLLVTEFRSNKPLLLKLMDELGISVPVTMGGPPVQVPPGYPKPGEKIDLRRYLELPACMIRVPSGELRELSKTELIRSWAEQHGGAHEDWAQGDAFISFRDFSLFIGGRQVAVGTLAIITRLVLEVAEQFLGQVTQS